jgi:hypothetical protein
MKRFEDGVVIYNMEKMLINKYALVHIDGPHNLDSVISESEFFIPRMSKDGFIIYDDVLDYDHDKVHVMLMERGFDLIQNGNRKLTYKKK